MKTAPIRSPLDMLRAQARLIALSSAPAGSAEHQECEALRDALDHYRCMTDFGIAATPAPTAQDRQPDLARPS